MCLELIAFCFLFFGVQRSAEKCASEFIKAGNVSICVKYISFLAVADLKGTI